MLALAFVIAAGVIVSAQGLRILFTAPSGDSANAFRLLLSGLVVFAYVAYSRATWTVGEEAGPSSEHRVTPKGVRRWFRGLTGDGGAAIPTWPTSIGPAQSRDAANAT